MVVLPAYRSDVQRPATTIEAVVVVVVVIVALVLVEHLVRHQWLVRSVAVTDMAWYRMRCVVLSCSQSALTLSCILSEEMIGVVTLSDLSLG